MPRNNTALDKASSHLESIIEQAHREGTSRLPDIARLAAEADVGRVTMWRALQVLRTRGDILLKPGRGIHIAAMTPAPASVPGTDTPPVSHTRSHRIARQMMADLLSHQLDPARPLPSIKDLVRRYGVSHNTMRKAISLLRAGGALMGDHRVCNDLVPRSGSARVVLIAAGENGMLHPITARTSDHLRQMEHVCASSGARLRLLGLTSAMTGNMALLDRGLRELGDTGEATGYVIWRVGIGDFKNVITLINRLLASGKRVSLLDEYNDLRRSWFNDPLKALRLWSMAVSPRCAQSVARHLLAAGHRHVAYITPFTQEEQSDVRLAGLRRSFADAGPGNTVRACTLGLSDGLIGNDGLSVLFSLNRAIDVFRHGIMPGGYLGWKLRQPANRNNPVATRLTNARRILDRFDTKSDSPGLFDEQLDTVLEYDEITAWVADNDIMAAQCIEFLRRRSRTGRAITVVGFDDSELASHLGFTSYNFNGAAVMHAMVRHALGHTLPKGEMNKNGAEEIQGFVNVRVMPAQSR